MRCRPLECLVFACGLSVWVWVWSLALLPRRVCEQSGCAWVLCTIPLVSEACILLAASVHMVLTVRHVVWVCAACDSMTVAGCVWGPRHAWHAMTGHTWLTCTQHASMPASPQGLCCIETIISFVAFALSSAAPDSCPRVQQQQLLTGPKQQSASFNV